MQQSSFSPKARWDRRVSGSANFNPENLNQKIEVFSWFKNGKIYPRMFVWKNKKYKIKKVNYNWHERIGQELINFFSVSTGLNLYQISFNNTSFSWLIDKIID